MKASEVMMTPHTCLREIGGDTPQTVAERIRNFVKNGGRR